MSDYDLSGDYGDQLSLDPVVPAGGQLFRQAGKMNMAVVIGVAADRRRTITYRHADEEHQMALQDFLAVYRRCRLDGTLL